MGLGKVLERRIIGVKIAALDLVGDLCVDCLKLAKGHLPRHHEERIRETQEVNLLVVAILV